MRTPMNTPPCSAAGYFDHQWVPDTTTLDPYRTVVIDPMAGTMEYEDGEPVYNYPYTPPQEGQMVCTGCGRTSVLDLRP